MNCKRIRIFKLILILCIIQTAFVLWGCENKPEEEKETPTEKFASVAEDGVTAVKAPQGKEIVDGVGNNYIPKEDQFYNFETDYNNRIISANRVTDIKSGIVMGDDVLLIFNKDTKKGQLFCGLPDCNHLTDSCRATRSSMFQYYDGDIYSVDSLWLTLKRRSIDAVSIDTVGNLLTVDKVEGSNEVGRTSNWIIHRGYIYYIYFYNAGFDEDAYYLNNSNCIFRKPLDGSGEAECIMPLTPCIDPWSCRLSAAGSYIYIGMGRNESGYDKDIYRYNTETDRVESFKGIDDNIVYVCCNNNNGRSGFYYVKNRCGESGEIYFYDDREDKKELIATIEENIVDIYMDNDYMYIYREEGKQDNGDADTYMGVYDYDGNRLCEVKLLVSDPEEGEASYIRKHVVIFYGSDDRYIYFQYHTGTEEYSYNISGMPHQGYDELMVIDKAKLKEGNLEYEIWGK